jgi:hypothetical protein
MTLHFSKITKFIFVIIILLLVNQAMMAQENTLNSEYSGTSIPSYLGLVTNMNNEDFLLGLSFMPPSLKGLDLRFICSFWARPYGKSVLIKYTDRIYFVYKEELYDLSFGLDKELALSRDLSLFAAVESGFVYKCYRGSNRDNLDISFPIATGGIGYGFLYNEHNNSNQFLLRLGYQYCKMSIYPNRFYFAVFVIL